MTVFDGKSAGPSLLAFADDNRKVGRQGQPFKVAYIYANYCANHPAASRARCVAQLRL